MSNWQTDRSFQAEACWGLHALVKAYGSEDSLDQLEGHAEEHCPHPCYLGASYLNCGWAWLYECQAYPDTGSEACWEVGADRYPTRYRAEVQRTWEGWWPHRCTHRPQERWQCLE